MHILAALRDEAERTAKLVGELSPDQLSLQTPCTGFDVRALVNHLCLGAEFISRSARGDKNPPDYERDFGGDDPAGAFERWKDEMLAALSQPGLAERTVYLPGMEVPGVVLFLLALTDAVVHRWDLARATGADPLIEADRAAELLEQVRPMIPDQMRARSPSEATASIPFGPEVPVPADASPVDKLVAFLGRNP